MRELEQIEKLVQADPVGFEVSLEQLDREMLQGVWKLVEQGKPAIAC